VKLPPVLAALSLLLAATATAGTIVLVDGRSLEADRVWYEGTELRYHKDGTLYGLPRALVARIEPQDLDAFISPDVDRSRERLAAGDAKEARRFARLALFHDPASVPGLEALAAAQLALGDPGRARESVEAALRLEPRRHSSAELLGDALAALGHTHAARAQYRAALKGITEPRLRRKLEALGPAPSLVSSARFRISYDGTADEALGLEVLGVLDESWEQYEARLGFSPDLPVTVVLQTAGVFRDTTPAPEWAAGWNDGTIRVPVQGMDRPTPGLVRILRHELAHSFVAFRIGRADPTWLHEGLAQWLEGGDPGREDSRLAATARTGQLLLLSELESPFSEFSEARAAAAYAQSLSASAHLLRISGPGGLARLIDVLGEGWTTDEALQQALGLGYDELQRSWQAYLERADAKGRTSAAGR
jgi:tetratricopeptide (TPR) repeat protein